MRIPDPFIFQQRELDCGGQAIWQHDQHCGHIILGVAIKAGSLCDPLEKRGLAHLMEHMTFEGTERFRHNIQLSRETESFGGFSNGFTNSNMTILMVMMPAWEARRAWTVLSQMVFHPLLRQVDLERQIRDVTLEIASAKNDFPSEFDQYRLHRQLFGTARLLGSSTLGSSESLQRITIADLQQFHRRYYQPANMIYIATGNLSQFPRPWPSFLDRQFRGISSSQRHPWRNSQLAKKSSGCSWVIPRSKEGSPQILVNGRIHTSGSSTFELLRQAHNAAALIEHILADAGQTSIMCQELREKRNLVYEFGSQLYALTPSARMWSFNATSATVGQSQQVLDILRKTVQRPELFSRRKIDAAKRQKLGRLALNEVSANDRFGWIIRFISESPRIPSLSEWWRTYEDLTEEDVQEVLARDFDPHRWVTLKYYPVSE